MSHLGLASFDFNQHYLAASNFVFTYLKDSTGSRDMNIDGGTTPVTFSYAVPAEKEFLAVHIIMFLVDGGIGHGEFGGLGSVLSTGLEFGVYRDGSQLVDFTGGYNITSNEDFMIISEGSVQLPAAGDDGFHIVFNLAEDAQGYPAQLKQGDSIRLTVNDDLSELTSFRTMIHGLIFDSAKTQPQLL